jgi:hypothetical protein
VRKTVVVVVVAALCVVAVLTMRAWRSRCRSYVVGLRGEIMRTDNGEFLYFNGTCWTTEPMPPLDAPF